MRRFLLAAILLPIIAGAQEAPPPAKLALHPATISAVIGRHNLTYLGEGDSALTFDLYQSRRRQGAQPVFIVFNVIGRGFKDDPLNSGWARLAAAEGFAGIVYQVPDESRAVASFDALLAHLRRNAIRLGIQSDSIVVWAGSTNARIALPTAEDASRTTIRALLLYYGAGSSPSWRRDLPVLVVRAGLDQPLLQRLQIAMIDSMISRNLPVTLINHPHATHPFEDQQFDATSREIMRQTFAFAHTALLGTSRGALEDGALAANTAAALLREEWPTAVAGYQELHRQHPDDFNLTQRLGDALLGARRFSESGAAYDSALAQGSWRRVELALGAIAAYGQAGDLDRTRTWLDRIPPSWESERILSRIGAAASVPQIRELILQRTPR
ncbi:MAG: hypothetical protein V4558_09125 [Gemmatimonadota bacterium]